MSRVFNARWRSWVLSPPLSSPFIYTIHMMIIVVVVIAMMMMDEPHCPWVIYNNDLYGAVQCSRQGRSESYIRTVF